MCPREDVSLSHFLETDGFPTLALLTAFLHKETGVSSTSFLFDSSLGHFLTMFANALERNRTSIASSASLRPIR